MKGFSQGSSGLARPYGIALYLWRGNVSVRISNLDQGIWSLIKVTFSTKDEILAAIVRSLAVQAAGFQVVGGLNKKYLEANGYYKFPFAGQDQAIRFQKLIADYVPESLQKTMQILPDSH